ncbi:DNA-binding transcriptional regulator, MerR family [Saccharopolyspora kobensis]|uniref:DNA-binding transcriptional regulator, MerR family n=1 Tax=Saccharopolyspora kobensis TaxID=146035 RepID=A0A1H6EEU0_9PSEU|nr:MerR family transcriptional regulator [Saccharopolyspora kobensis]SEG96300.1 DNA-binding transcriptional regulator, MerR family [Saccharopolyspora kobensis]SFD20620.1 DNA-binding transcriptional regulator, MerR family [Saccharopolyspora kobensis]
MPHSVGEAARISGTTVRTLHHYDEIGLLTPSARTAAGYRSYSDADLDRLRRILGYRAMDLGLDEIATILADGTDREHLRRQRELLLARIDRLQRVVAAVERELEASTMGVELTQEEKFELFGDFDPDDHAEEAERRWGGTDAYRQSQQRMSSFTKQDWQRFMAEQQEVGQRLAQAKQAGVAPDSEQAMDLAEEHRRHITRWCYDCTYEIHRGLGDMYVADERFTDHYEKLEPGLAAYIRTAIHANADRAGE